MKNENIYDGPNQNNNHHKQISSHSKCSNWEFGLKVKEKSRMVKSKVTTFLTQTGIQIIHSKSEKQSKNDMWQKNAFNYIWTIFSFRKQKSVIKIKEKKNEKQLIKRSQLEIIRTVYIYMKKILNWLKLT